MLKLLCLGLAVLFGVALEANGISCLCHPKVGTLRRLALRPQTVQPAFPARYRVDLCVHRRRLPGRGDTTTIARFPKSGCSAMPCSTSRRRQSASVSPLSFARLSRHHV